VATIGFYVVNIFAIAVPLAIFEIWLEKFKSGWGGEFYNPFWGKKIRTAWIMRVAEKDYLTPYHFLMFLGILPIIYGAEWVAFSHVAVGPWWFVLSFRDISISPILYFPALWIGVATLEDFLYFALNWRWPNALTRLFNAEMPWHTDYVRISTTKQVPRFYLICLIYVVLLLAAQHLIARLI
jgi:hypothetical protein